MKRKLIITLTIILLSITGYTQDKRKEDSLKVVEYNKVYLEFQSKVTLKEFTEWLFDYATAKKFQEIGYFLDVYLNIKTQEKLKLPKQNTTK